MFHESLAEKLFVLIEAENLTEILVILNDLDDNDDKKLKKLDLAKDIKGRTLLHAALDCKNPEIFDALLEMDLSLKEKNAEGKTVLEIAEERNLKAVCAKLRSRVEWQGTIETFRFNRVVNLIEKSLPNIEPAKGFDKMLFLGATGAGKSTLLNYLNGTNYKVSHRYGIPVAQGLDGPNGGSEEIAKMGNNLYRSETLYPQVVSKSGLNFVYCDLAGLFDSRGLEKQICATSSANLLVRLAGGIKGIMVLFDIPGFNSLRGSAFKKTALALAEITRMNPELMDAVYFVITKVPPNFTVTSGDIIDEYVNPLLETLDGGLEHEEKAVQFVLTEMVARENQILIPKIDDMGQSREEIEHLLQKTKSKRAELFNFLSHDNAQACFNNVLLNIGKSFLMRHNEITIILPSKLAENKKSQDAETARIKIWGEEIEGIEQELLGNFDATKIEASQQIKKATITTDEQELAKISAKVVAYDIEIAKAKIKRAGLANDDMIEIERKNGDFSGNPVQYLFKYKSPYALDRIQTNYNGYGVLSERQIRPEMTSEKGIDPRDGKEVTFYKSDDDAKSGNYEAEFRASRGLISVQVTFYAKRRDMNLAEIARLDKEIMDNLKLKQDLVDVEIPRIEKEIQRLKEEIIADAVQILAGEAQFEVRKDQLRARKAALLTLIEEAGGKLNNLCLEEDNYNGLITQYDLEIEVNRNIYRITNKIIDILGLDEMEFLQFQKEFKEYSQHYDAKAQEGSFVVLRFSTEVPQSTHQAIEQADDVLSSDQKKRLFTRGAN